MDEIARAASIPITPLSSADIGAIAHLYRAEVYRSTVWRSRLDTTTNWAVVTTGIALSVTFAHVDSSPLPLMLAGLLVAIFLFLEARRYRYFDVWRRRARTLELAFYAPMLRGDSIHAALWRGRLADDYDRPIFRLSHASSIGQRLRKNYAGIFLIQAVAYFGKIVIHPTPVGSATDLLARAALGPIPGEAILLAGVAFHAGWIVFAFVTREIDRRARLREKRPDSL